MNTPTDSHFMDPFVLSFDHFEELRQKLTAEARPLIVQARSFQDATGLAPSAYVLPASWDPGPDPSDTTWRPADESLRPPSLFGRPVMWDPEERLGLFYEVPQ